MAYDTFDESLLTNFSNTDKLFLRHLFKKMTKDSKLLDRLSQHVGNCMRERNTVDFLKLSEDLRAQACFEYIVIGLLSGEIKKADVEKCV